MGYLGRRAACSSKGPLQSVDKQTGGAGSAASRSAGGVELMRYLVYFCYLPLMLLLQVVLPTILI